MVMEYEDLIDDEEESVPPSPEKALDPDPDEPRAKSSSKSPWKAFILTGLIASLIGAFGGGYGVYAGLKAQSPSAAEMPNVDLAPLESKIASLTTRLEAAEVSVKKAANRPTPKPAPTAEPVDLSGLEKRLDALESAPLPEIDPAALTALQSAQKDGFDWPDTSSLEDRLAELETKLDETPEMSGPTDLLDRLETLEAEFESAQAEEASDGLDDAQAERLDALEARLTALENRPAPKANIERVSILAFPKDAMVAAVEDNIEGGILKKTLSRHVRVKDENDPLTLIEGIEADIAKGRLNAAIKKYDQLPEPIRTAGLAWYESVKASL